MFKKDHGVNTKYFIPEINNSPLTVWNNAGTFNRYDLWDFFGVLEDQSAPGSASPFEKWANIRVDASHLTSNIKNAMQWPELGRLVNGFFSLTFFNGGIGGGGAVVGGCGVLAELVGTTGGGGILGGGGYGCGGGVGPPKLPQPPPDVPPCVKVNVCVPGGEEDAQYLESLGVVVCRECITIVVGGGGGGGGDCRCDSDNMAYIGGGVSAGESIRTSTGWIKEPCKCKLRVKAGATASEMNKPDSCCYYLDCGDAGKYDIYNSKVDAVRKGCGDSEEDCTKSPNCYECCKNKMQQFLKKCRTWMLIGAIAVILLIILAGIIFAWEALFVINPIRVFVSTLELGGIIVGGIGVLAAFCNALGMGLVNECLDQCRAAGFYTGPGAGKFGEWLEK